MHASIKDSKNPDAKPLLEMGEKIEQLLRAKGFDPTQGEVSVDHEKEYMLYGHELLETPEVRLSFNYTLPHDHDPDELGSSVDIALHFTGQEGPIYGPRIVVNCWCRKKEFSLDREDLEEEAPPAADRLEEKLLRIIQKRGHRDTPSLSEETGIELMRELIAYAKRAKKREGAHHQRKLRPTK